MMERLFRNSEAAAGLLLIGCVVLVALVGVAYAATTGYHESVESRWKHADPLERCKRFRYMERAAAECVRGIMRMERLKELRETCHAMEIGADECIREVVRAEIGTREKYR